MNKIRKISFKNHPVLQNLNLDFCDSSGKAVNTVIFAGENGTGKSTIIDSLFRVVSRQNYPSVTIEFETDTGLVRLEHEWLSVSSFRDNFFNSKGENVSNEMNSKLFGIYSDVDINFHSAQVNTVTSLSLDSEKGSRRSGNDLPQRTNQLLIDIQALDDADLSRAYRLAKEHKTDTNTIEISERMSRFKQAFSMMFENMTYDRIENEGGHKSIIFKKNGIDFSIEGLSSGEKQIVYRGCFLLKDINALRGAFVFIDEPEISLHPVWQSKIMDYYKGIFTDTHGIQTSQLFVVTHSPFIIHNDNRKNDKVIVMARDVNGMIIVKDKPEYYRCNSLEVIHDAFSIRGFSAEKSTVYLEGRTDEKYFDKVLEVFGYLDIPFQFKWIGYIDDSGQEANTGKDALNKAVAFLVGRNLPIKNVCLFDCDTNKHATQQNNVFTKAIPSYESSKSMKKGIENALILDDIDLTSFYSYKEKEGDYGDNSKIAEFKKMECCDAICVMDNETLKKVFKNLKTVVDDLLSIFEE